ncbi:hypothetical protein [Kribbella sp. DT2]|uniref:hypothetical protein n=1 Tax=Kribbella sp. DT2 TaxID=3393427 RepID=UPI003CE80E17
MPEIVERAEQPYVAVRAKATGDLLAWAEQEGLEWDADGDRWGARLEVYKSDPLEVPDRDQWETELLFRLRG